MDGLTIRNAEGLLQSGETLSQMRRSEMSPQVSSLGESSSSAGDLTSGVSSKSFADTLNEAVNTVNTLQKTSDAKMQDLATGKADNIPEVLIAAEKADIALRLMVQMRNKMIEAYQEVMKLQF